MYGMVNKTLQNSIEEQYGKAVWETIAKSAGIDTDTFIEMQTYPDDSTYSLVGAACEELNTSAEQFLEWFGREWIKSTSGGNYKSYYEMESDLTGFLQSLNSMHQDLSSVMPGLKPPHFRIQPPENGRAVVEYYSERAGLTMFVVGLLKGLADYYHQSVQIHVAERKEDNKQADVFHIIFND